MFLVLLAIAFSVSAAGQRPAFFVLGEEQFRGIQIYDVIQDERHNYWFATNEGLYYYDHYNYMSVNLPGAKSKSAFGFVADTARHIIYCHNLSKQVFRIIRGRCELFYELKDGEGSADMSLAVAGNGDVVIAARAVIVLDTTGKVCSRYTEAGRYLSPAYLAANGEVLVYQGAGAPLLSYANGVLRKRVLHFARGVEAPHIVQFFSIGNDCYAIDLVTGRNYRFHTAGATFEELPGNARKGAAASLRVYTTGDGAWVAGALPGVRFFPGAVPVASSTVLYQDYFISHVYQDHEGNTLLSTFDKGVLVIPDLNMEDAIVPFADDPVRSVHTTGEPGSLYMGTTRGKLLRYSPAGVTMLDQAGSKGIEGIYVSSGRIQVVYDNGNLSALLRKSGLLKGKETPSLKDAAIVSDDVFYMATNLGISEVNVGAGRNFSIANVPGLNSRGYFIEADSETGLVYGYTSDGLFVLSPGGAPRSILYRNAPIVANGICCARGKAYVSTPANGVLVIDDASVATAIVPRVEGRLEELRDIQIYNNTIIGQSRNGLYQFAMDGRMLRALHIDYRFSGKKVIDFSLRGDTAWVCHSGGVQRINMSYTSPVNGTPVIRLDSVLVNDEPFTASAGTGFESHRRKFEFIVSSPTLRDKEYTRYHYRLLGYDDRWKVHTYTQNHIVYNALAPGDYTMEVKVVCNGRESETVNYSFRISQPFYLRWYFIAAAMMAFVLLVLLVYQWQLRIQRRRAKQVNELNASRLTAIRSQMNPHFIFNALNSIQDLILKGNVEQSYSYITTFSDLIRRSLDYSGKDLIDFDQELKLIELYLALEKLRFKKDFHYTINTGGVSDIQIPPMLIQPFIENAIAHGLLHKEGAKELTVTFHLAEALVCRIEDNGVGRERAQAILKRQRAGHESFSGEAIKRRFEILSEMFGGSFGYVYEDKENGSGTVVVLTIPAVTHY
ncbi:MAG: histidine kinase [Flavipsychrobacter sp.]|nr:histidine kinase [Flavipsychrobacter sp.]